MNELDREELEVQLLKLKASRGDMALSISKKKRDIQRIEESLVIQDKKIKEVEKALSRGDK